MGILPLTAMLLYQLGEISVRKREGRLRVVEPYSIRLSAWVIYSFSLARVIAT